MEGMRRLGSNDPCWLVSCTRHRDVDGVSGPRLALSRQSESLRLVLRRLVLCHKQYHSGCLITTSQRLQRTIHGHARILLDYMLLFRCHSAAISAAMERTSCYGGSQAKRLKMGQLIATVVLRPAPSPLSPSAPDAAP